MIARAFAKLFVKYPKTVLLVFTVITAIVGTQIQNVYMVSDLTSYLPEDEPVLKLWGEINDEFQIGSAIVIYVEADDIRDPYVLIEMDRVSTKINKYDLDKGEQDGIFSVTSIASLIKNENAKPPIPGGLGGTGTFEIPEDRNLISSYIARAEVQAVEGVLYVDSFDVAVIIVQLAEDANPNIVLENINAAIDREARYSDMTVTGLLAVQEAIRVQSMQNMMLIFPIALVFISIVIFFFQRSVKGILIVFLPLAYALILTFGVLGVIQPQLTLLSIAIVALLVGLGVDYSIHLLNRFTEENSTQDKITQVERTLKLTGKAVFLSSITTVIGFGSLMVSDMPPIVVFGFGCASGILFCFIAASIIVPCLALVLKYEKKEGAPKGWKQFATFAVNNRKKILVVACFFAFMSLIVLPNIETDVDVVDIAPEGLIELEKYEEFSEIFGGGTNPNMILIETEKEGLTHPETIEAIWNMEEEMREIGATVSSIAGPIKEINDILERSIIIEKLAEFVDGDQIILDMVKRRFC